MLNFENDGLKVLERVGSNKKQTATWKCLCKKCGNIFTTKGTSIRDGRTRSCGCVHSWNEQLITKMFLENNIEFATQYTFPDLKGTKNGFLRFDFAVFKNGKLSHLIEYNGKQLKKDNCCIIANRHMHINTPDLNKYNLKDGQIVKIKISGIKGAILDNVIVKASCNYTLEVHLDVDDGNAHLIDESNDLVEVIYE